MSKISIAKQKASHNSNKIETHSQLGLFGLFPGNASPQSPQPKEIRPTNPPQSKPRPKPKELAIVPIPQSEFEGDRYCLRYGDFKLQFELPKQQAYELLARTSRLDWSLDDRGVPANIQQIWAAVELEIEGGEQ